MSESVVRYYEPSLVEIKPPEPGEFRIETAAILMCGLCGEAIDGMGGPGDGAMCERCVELLRAGRLRGCVKWPKD